jgi:hypothetical protein
MTIGDWRMTKGDWMAKENWIAWSYLMAKWLLVDEKERHGSKENWRTWGD